VLKSCSPQIAMDSPGFEPDGKRSLRSRLRDSNPASTIFARKTRSDGLAGI
jgi:hypothetical protein